MIPFARKPRVAFFDFACCEGCQLSILEMDDKLFDLLTHVEVVAWREVMSETSEEYDIAFCEGSITREQDRERIKTIRAQAEIVVSLGTCASISCHNALKNKWATNELLAIVYSEYGEHIDTIPARPIADVVKVDYQILGCPVSLPEFATVFKRILTRQAYTPPNQPVCVECKRNDTLCVHEKGMVCLGPVTRCGCNAICTAFGDACRGCRGLIDEANLAAPARALFREKLHPIMAGVARNNSLTAEEIMAGFAIYNDKRRVDKGEASSDGTA